MHNISDEKSYQTAHPLKESLAREAETMDFLSQEIERVDCCGVEQHEDGYEDDWIDKELFDRFFSCQKQSGSPVEDYISRSEIERVMDDTIKTVIKLSTRCSVTGIVKETIEDEFRVGYNEQMEWNWTAIRNMLENALIGPVEQDHLDDISVCTWISGLNPVVLWTHWREES